MLAHRRYSSVSSSSSGVFSEPSDGGTSSGNDSNSYYSEGSGSYRSVSSVLTSSRSGATTTAATAASSTSAVDSSSTNTFSDVLTTSSARSHSSAPPRRAVARSAASRSEVVGHKTTKGASGVVANHNNKGVGDTLAQRTVFTFTETTTASSATVDDTDALVSAPQSPMPQAALAPVSNRTADVAREKRYHISEEELVRHPWAPVDCDTTVDARKGGGDRGGLALSVLDTIHTVSMAVPPPPEEAQRRREEGGLTYPSRLTLRFVRSSSPLRHCASAVAQDKDGTGNGGGGATLGTDGATATRARKTFICCCFHGCSGKAPCKMKSYTAMRRKRHHPLRSHHVPLVNFCTTREHGIPMEGVQNVLPSVEEAAGYQNLKVDMMGTEELPKQLQKAIQPWGRPASGLRLEKSYAFGHGAGGGQDGAGQSAFMRDGDPQGFWIAQLHRHASVRLEPIGIE
ncbi:hypothetical protein, unknown function [Leishmania infantum JPCM5]|uniref:Uncharacterized protein n=2 Tax=Leishmania infantum TaxID=5671 RepID=A4HST7_LEIIN|nr:hypothetical protein, unknown function [Leishmania infantum JPCM5]CAC9445756.1 hypothetical_protein_-_conserved [Leishmania infantum]CAM65478.1 hypothetical protein, unknown function [Leishmania infantum JPCM5]SUZ39093.1 hypothetical_protein_-_conserved [Leishmania infantum]|eukprot:XP_001463128.1 hypothetical protein, unknown function [Leishmania infantum JPCM5]